MTELASGAALAAYALVLSVPVPALLLRAAWVTRAPRLATGLWLALPASWLASLVLSALRPALGLVLPGRPAPAGFALLAAAAGGALAVGIAARAGYLAAREVITVRRRRRWHARALAAVGRPLPGLDATMVDHRVPAVYCVPGPRLESRIVVTTGALGVLSQRQLAAALAHERAHLRAGNHLPATLAASLSLAFPGVPLLRHARHEIAILAEMAADDDASRKHGRTITASALAALAGAQAPEPALNAGGHTVVHRIQRLLDPAPPLPLPARLAGITAAVGSLALPVALACTTIVVLVAMAASSLAG